MRHTNQKQLNVRRRIRKRKSVSALVEGQNVVFRNINDLQPYAKNARRHDAKQIGQLRNSIYAFGFMNPIIVDSDDVVIAGHGRRQAAIELGMTKVPVIEVTHLSDAEVKAYRLADNKLAENSKWDEGLLQIELAELIDLELAGDLSFDFNTIGFETAELDIMLTDAVSEDLEEFVEGPAAEPICKVGETWVLGKHRIACMSALVASSFVQLLDGDEPSLINTDPPYNVHVNGHVRSGGAAKHREFAMASGEMTTSEFTDFLKTSLGHAVAAARAGAIMMSFIDWRHLNELDAACRALHLEQINLCVWVKTNGGMGSLYRSQHELCAIYKLPGGAHINNVQLGAMGRNRTNVWEYAGVNSFGHNRSADLADHPTVKPVAMIEDAIKDVTNHGDIVLDPFGGSGTTLLAAERCRRRARLLEIDPLYVDVTIRRWQELTGEQAYNLETNETWNDRAARASDEQSDEGDPADD
ncbi:site-specific DNA-methyltransferase [Sulfitobacter mediterraneus]|uniref:site-specific DNA-methyltransferase n=1 Tax=Sulfitobacter mediterraneus TaxID=83219 RepID=UPI002169048A|nr:DNA methyltransferase [Sulfitobacter mediterraneus]